MVPAILIIICMMWLPVALLNLGKGEAKGTAFVTGMVSLYTVVGAFIQAAVFNDSFIAGLLFVHGIFYGQVAYTLWTGAEDARPLGNVSLTTALVSTIYMIIAWTGGPVVEGNKLLIEKSNFLALACAGYAALTYMVFLNAYGKFSGKVIGVSLIIWVIVGLWIPAFWLLGAGKLPF